MHRFLLHRDYNLGLKKSDRSHLSLFTDVIFDFNNDTSIPGGVSVAFWSEWQAMLEDLRKVGPVWRLLRASHCALAVQGDYPGLTYSADGLAAKAANEDGAMICHFKNWRNAIAFDSSCCCGRKYGVEIKNDRGEVFHRICLSRGTDVASFVEWVQVHQATG